MNKIIQNLTIQNFRNFKFAFENTKEVFWDEVNNRLIHPGEFGEYRESLAKKWLLSYTREQFGISSGFIINSANSISPQCDLIIYDRLRTPKIENVDNQRFFPVETVAGVIEIKSDIGSIGELNTHLVKLSEVKKLRSQVVTPRPYYRKFPSEFNPDLNPLDNIFTILICNQLSFTGYPDNLNYGDVDPRLKHNMILSLRDGLINYITLAGSKNQYLPFIGKHFNSYNLLLFNEAELPPPIIAFLSAYNSLLDLTTLLELDMTHYLTDNVMKVIK